MLESSGSGDFFPLVLNEVAVFHLGLSMQFGFSCGLSCYSKDRWKLWFRTVSAPFSEPGDPPYDHSGPGHFMCRFLQKWVINKTVLQTV